MGEKFIDYRVELDKEEKNIAKLMVTKNAFDTYDDVIKKEKKECLSGIFCFAFAWSLVSAFTKDSKFSSTLLMITIYSILEVLKYHISNMRMTKILNETDLEELEMKIYNSEERMKGFNNVLYADVLNGGTEKVYCKK